MVELGSVAVEYDLVTLVQLALERMLAVELEEIFVEQLEWEDMVGAEPGVDVVAV